MGININLTNPDNPPIWFQSKKSSIQYKENVVRALLHIGVPTRIAEVAVIDLKYKITSGYHNKLLPNATATLMMDMINKIYKYSDGAWH